jgi:NAD(P)-dependent dehydrogenase (short-subunit alcohol dehydrogenase family)
VTPPSHPGNAGPVVAVTGGSGGIGRAIVDRQRAAGWRALVLDLHPASTGSNASAEDFLACDVTDERSVDEAFEALRAAAGRLDGLVVAAGTMSTERIEQATAAEWDRVLAVNVRGAALTCRAALPLLEPGSSVVLLSSAAGLNARTVTGVAYAVSKAALVHLARVLSAEQAHRGIRVNAVCPGAVQTEMSAIFPTTALEAAAEATVRGAIMQPSDVAGVVRFLLDDESMDINGEALPMGTFRP